MVVRPAPMALLPSPFCSCWRHRDTNNQLHLMPGSEDPYHRRGGVVLEPFAPRRRGLWRFVPDNKHSRTKGTVTPKTLAMCSASLECHWQLGRQTVGHGNLATCCSCCCPHHFSMLYQPQYECIIHQKSRPIDFPAVQPVCRPSRACAVPLSSAILWLCPCRRVTVPEDAPGLRRDLRNGAILGFHAVCDADSLFVCRPVFLSMFHTSKGTPRCSLVRHDTVGRGHG